ncbi:MAG: SpoIIE family protein phosphatase [bacterium]|nr:SpoIIE family protein phosphatase [bacterium]
MKRISINILFSVCLSVIIGISFFVLLLISSKYINKAKLMTEKKASENITLLIDTVFTENIKEESTTINNELQYIVNHGKQLAFLINTENNNQKEPYKFKFKFDNNTGFYKYFNPKHIDIINGRKFGFFAVYNNGKHQPEYLQPKVNSFVALLPLFREICKLNKMIVAIRAFYFDGLILSYMNFPKINFAIQNEDKESFNRLGKYVDNVFKNDTPVFKLFRSKRDFNESAISIVFPIKNRENRISGVTFFYIPYDIVISKLKEVVYSDNGNNYKTLRLIIDDNRNIAYLSLDSYELLSLPVNNNKLSPVDTASAYIKESLDNSTDLNVRSMGKQFFKNSSGRFEVEIKGKTYIAIFETLPVNNWKVALLVKKEDLFKPLTDVENTYKTIFREIYVNYLLSFLIVLIAGFLVSFFIFRKLFINPIEHLRKDASKLGKGDFDAKVCESGLKEIYDLSKTFNNLGGQLKIYTENLKAEIKTRQTIETELKIAGDLQQSVLPKITAGFNTDSFELYSKLVPAKEMSGDFYDYFYLNNNNTLVLVLADVSGKGITSAFYMSMAKAIIKETCLASENDSPGDILRKVNNILCKNDDSCMFLTMYLIFYDIHSGRFSYANAGHHEFICIDNEYLTTVEGLNNNLAIGIIEDREYITSEFTLNKGQVLSLFTDGIIEAPDKNGNEYGIERLETIYKESYKGNLDEIGEYIIKDVMVFQNNIKFDDTTLLMLKRLK